MDFENITLADIKDVAAQLDLVRGVTVEVYPENRQFIVALYDRHEPKSQIQGSWLGTAEESLRKLRDIQKRYGNV